MFVTQLASIRPKVSLCDFNAIFVSFCFSHFIGEIRTWRYNTIMLQFSFNTRYMNESRLNKYLHFHICLCCVSTTRFFEKTIFSVKKVKRKINIKYLSEIKRKKLIFKRIIYFGLNIQQNIFFVRKDYVKLKYDIM